MASFTDGIDPYTARAFGNCTNCYGKGYSTQTVDGRTQIDTCSCERGKKLDELLALMHRETVTNLLQEAMMNLSEESVIARFTKLSKKEKTSILLNTWKGSKRQNRFCHPKEGSYMGT